MVRATRVTAAKAGDPTRRAMAVIQELQDDEHHQKIETLMIEDMLSSVRLRVGASNLNNLVLHKSLFYAGRVEELYELLLPNDREAVPVGEFPATKAERYQRIREQEGRFNFAPEPVQKLVKTKWLVQRTFAQFRILGYTRESLPVSKLCWEDKNKRMENVKISPIALIFINAEGARFSTGFLVDARDGNVDQLDAKGLIITVNVQQEGANVVSYTAKFTADGCLHWTVPMSSRFGAIFNDDWIPINEVE